MPGTRSSPRRLASQRTATESELMLAKDDTNELLPGDDLAKDAKPKRKAKSPAKKPQKSKVKKSSNLENGKEDDSAPKSPSKKSLTKKIKGSPAKKRKGPAIAQEEGEEDTNATSPSKNTSPSKKKKKKTEPQRITDVDNIPKLWTDEMAQEKGSRTFRVASWNVAGLRAFVKKQPTALADICKDYNLDMLCLQEHKLQESHLDDPKLNFRGYLKDEGYDDYWSCSTAKKGYSGTVIFVRQHGKKKTKQKDISGFFKAKSKEEEEKKKENKKGGDDMGHSEVVHSNVTYGIGRPIDSEGRSITVEFPFATITNVYVPNSGQNLERLDYRTKEWDKDFLAFQEQKEKERNLPVIWLGDLNIAHKAYDIWNEGAPHLPKQAGVTPQERDSFQEQLDRGYIDAFRKLHPEAKGHYSYWSQRAGNREPNKGLRLDYFVCSPSLFSEDSKAVIRDSYMLPNLLGSDHAPVVLEIEIKKKY